MRQGERGMCSGGDNECAISKDHVFHFNPSLEEMSPARRLKSDRHSETAAKIPPHGTNMFLQILDERADLWQIVTRKLREEVVPDLILKSSMEPVFITHALDVAAAPN